MYGFTTDMLSNRLLLSNYFKVDLLFILGGLVNRSLPLWTFLPRSLWHIIVSLINPSHGDDIQLAGTYYSYHKQAFHLFRPFMLKRKWTAINYIHLSIERRLMWVVPSIQRASSNASGRPFHFIFVSYIPSLFNTGGTSETVWSVEKFRHNCF